MKLRLPPRFRSRKFWQRSAFAAVSLATLIAAVYAIENARGKAAWARYRAEATAQGVKLDWRDFIPPPIPDEENFAAVPIMMERRPHDPAQRIDSPVARSFARMPNGFGNALSGERMRFEDWQKCFLEERLLTEATSDPLADVFRALEQCEPLLAQFREAMPRPRSQLVSDWEKGLDSDFWHLGNQLQIAKMFSLRVTALLASGRSEEALSDWRVQVRHAEILHNSPTLLAGMLRALLITMAVNPVWRGIAEDQWSEAQLAEIELALRPIDLAASYAWALQSERALANLMLDRAKQNRPFLFTLLPNTRKDRLLLAGLTPAGWIDQNQVRINRWFDAEIPKWNPSVAGTPRVDAPPQKGGWHPYRFVFDATIYGFGGNGVVCEDIQAGVELCRVACALQRFHLRTGAYPQSLDELRPALLPSIPPDRFDGQPLRYRRTDPGLVLYSVQYDRRDDGGDDAKDLVWRVPALMLSR